jgi:hypothetical protein
MSEIETQTEEFQFVMPKLTIDYPLPLPLEVIDQSVDWQDIDFVIPESQETFIIDEAGFVFVLQNGTLTPLNINGDNFNFFGVYVSPSENGKDIILEFSCKFTNGRLDNINLDAFHINEASLRINLQKENEKNNNKWSNKYIFHTNWYYFAVAKPITAIKKFVDILYAKAVQNSGRPSRSGCGCSGKK